MVTLPYNSVRFNFVKQSQGVKTEAGKMIPSEGIKPTFRFQSHSYVKTRHVDVVGPKWCLVGSEGLASVKTFVLTTISCLLVSVFLDCF